MLRAKPPKVPLAVGQYFEYTYANADAVAAWVEYANFCRKRGGEPLSTPDEFYREWEKLRAHYEASRKKRPPFMPKKPAQQKRRNTGARP
jgi:hypothetical protein